MLLSLHYFIVTTLYYLALRWHFTIHVCFSVSYEVWKKNDCRQLSYYYQPFNATFSIFSPFFLKLLKLAVGGIYAYFGDVSL